MKPSPCDRRACEIVRDFLVGLALFLAVFTLAMLDTRTTHSAPTIISKPATTGPGATGPGATSPGATSPGATGPGATSQSEPLSPAP